MLPNTFSSRPPRQNSQNLVNFLHRSICCTLSCNLHSTIRLFQLYNSQVLSLISNFDLTAPKPVPSGNAYAPCKQTPKQRISIKRVLDCENIFQEMDIILHYIILRIILTNEYKILSFFEIDLLFFLFYKFEKKYSSVLFSPRM